jgi:hypothetical protein
MRDSRRKRTKTNGQRRRRKRGRRRGRRRRSPSEEECAWCQEAISGGGGRGEASRDRSFEGGRAAETMAKKAISSSSRKSRITRKKR